MSNPVTRLNAVLEGRYAKVALRVLKPELAVVVGAERFLAERPRRWMGLVFVASALGKVLNNPILGGTRSVAVRRSGYEGLSER